MGPCFTKIKQHMNYRPNTWFDKEYTSVLKELNKKALKLVQPNSNHFFEPTFEDYSINKK